MSHSDSLSTGSDRWRNMPQWEIDAWNQWMRESEERRAEATAIKREAERQAGER